uniref:Uncharacterized protein n=1 Tax=Neobacillus citreus TaxID=2833578 RepID=A0A942T8T5_9BACI
MNDSTPTAPGDGPAAQQPRQDAPSSPSAPASGYGAPQTTAAPAGWGAAPAAGSTATLDAPVRPDPYGQQHRAEPTWGGTAPNGPTPWYGAAAQQPTKRAQPKPPWFWPVIAAAVGLAALLAGGGIGFAVGHALGGGQGQSTTQLPGGGTNQFPGYGNGGTNQLPGGTQDGSGTSGSGTSGSGSDSSSS